MPSFSERERWEFVSANISTNISTNLSHSKLRILRHIMDVIPSIRAIQIGWGSLAWFLSPLLYPFVWVSIVMLAVFWKLLCNVTLWCSLSRWREVSNCENGPLRREEERAIKYATEKKKREAQTLTRNKEKAGHTAWVQPQRQCLVGLLLTEPTKIPYRGS